MGLLTVFWVDRGPAAYRAGILHAVTFRGGSSTVETDTVALADERVFKRFVIEMPVATMMTWMGKDFNEYTVTFRNDEMIELDL